MVVLEEVAVAIEKQQVGPVCLLSAYVLYIVCVCMCVCIGDCSSPIHALVFGGGTFWVGNSGYIYIITSMQWWIALFRTTLG